MVHILHEPWLIRDFVVIYLSHQSPQLFQALAHQRDPRDIRCIHVFYLNVKISLSVTQRRENRLANVFDAPQVGHLLVVAFHFLKENAFVQSRHNPLYWRDCTRSGMDVWGQCIQIGT